MTVAEANRQVLAMMTAQLEEAGLDEKLIDPRSSDGDPGKFTLGDLTVRVIPPFNGFKAKINRSWFLGGDELPVIQRGRFHYYVIAIGERGNLSVVHYYFCDYRKLRNYALSFKGTKGHDHRDREEWCGQIHVLSSWDRRGYFRWGDDDEDFAYRDRYVTLDNVLEILEDTARAASQRSTGADSRSSECKAETRAAPASRLEVLKDYVLRNPEVIGIGAYSAGYADHRFESGDTADILFVSSQEIYVVEIEEEGAPSIKRAIASAAKLRAVYAVENEMDLDDPKLRALVVAFDMNYEKTDSTAKRYRVDLITVNENRL